MAETLARTRAFLAHSWPLEMLPEVEACEREVEAVLNYLREKNEIIHAYAGLDGMTPEDVAAEWMELREARERVQVLEEAAWALNALAKAARGMDRAWFHELFGLHDTAAHLDHHPLHVCVPLWMEVTALEDRIEARLDALSALAANKPGSRDREEPHNAGIRQQEERT